MILALLTAMMVSPPDTLAPAGIVANRNVSPPTQSVSGPILQNATSAADAIRDFSGIQLRDYGGVGGLKTVNVRSLGSAHTAIFMDGVPIDNAQNTQVDLGRFFTEDLETIELYAGQRSALMQTAREYGSASALHMRTALPQGRKLRVRLRGGAFGTIAPSGSAEMRKGRFAARIRLGGERANGQYPFHTLDLGKDTLLTRQNCDIKAFNAGAHLWFLPEGGRYQASVTWFDAGRGIPGPVIKQSGEYPMSEDRQYDRNLTAQLSGEQALGHGLSLLARVRYSNDALDYIDVSELDPSISATWNYRLQSAYLAASLGWRPLDWLHLNAAVDLQDDWLNCQFFAQRRQALGALSSAFIFDPWRVQASVQYMHTSDGYNFVSPALILDWHPREDWEFGFVGKRSCRLPSFNDLYYTNVGSRDLRPEKVWQVSAWWMWDRTYGPWHFRVREDLYFNHVQDKLIAVPNGSLFRWSMYNIGRVHIYGDEIEASAAYS
ncbi:MAG: TonB-dependent receptor, partial [Bacteroidales bacterium]|nr:TonB-dependent receptor [Bacteroidales bacterium]